MSEAEPRRSVRATKGQHKALEQLDQPLETPKKRGKKGKKTAREREEEPEEEVIRCVCGATEQGDDSGEPWIACDQCSVWQHNICVGLARFDEDIPEDYYCELCRPENHKELLEGIARGEKPWEARRKAAEEEVSEKKKKKAPKKAAKGKRNSDPKEEQTQSPAPDSKKEAKSSSVKRKARDDSQDKDSKPSQKLRKVSESEAVPVPAYNPPADLPAKISELPTTRQGPAKALSKSLSHSIGVAEKTGGFTPSDGIATAARAERLALEIERAVHDTHPNLNSYGNQARTLVHNLKGNPELTLRLLTGTLTPLMLAAMTTEDMAPKELQRENAEIKARMEKQSILIQDDGPRVRRTHKGEELVGGDVDVPTDDTPLPHARRSTIVRDRKSESLPPPPAADESTEPAVELPAHIEQTAPGRNALHIDTKHSQSPKTDFDINKVFSSVKSPTNTALRRPSTVTGPSAGPGIDPEVDRMLRDDGNESPPYSPTEENDPSVVWRGNLLMNTIADVQVAAKHVGGAKLNETIGLPWGTLFPKRLTVAGRIDQQKAVEYLCSLRYSSPTDIVVVSLEPAAETSKPAFLKLVDYFVSKKRYGVIGDKGVGNVRDTYLVPILAGTAGQPEFMLNLVDNFIPETRTEPMLLGVFVYRNNDPSPVQGRQGTVASEQTASQSPSASTPTPAQGAFTSRNPSISAPQFSPASPHGSFPNYPTPRNSQTPIQPPHMPRSAAPSQLPQPSPQQQLQQQPQQQPQQQAPQVFSQVRLEGSQGEQLAREILGPLISSPTVAFIMPHANGMQAKEWHTIRRVYERDVRAREDLNHLSAVLAMEPQDPANSAGTSAPAPNAGTVPQNQQHQQHQPLLQRPPPAHQTPVPPPVLPPQKTTPVPLPTVPAGPPRQTPIPPPNIPHHATQTTAPQAPTA